MRRRKIVFICFCGFLFQALKTFIPPAGKHANHHPNPNRQTEEEEEPFRELFVINVFEMQNIITKKGLLLCRIWALVLIS